MKKYIFPVLVLSLLIFSTPVLAQQIPSADVNTRIQALLSQLANLRQQLALLQQKAEVSKGSSSWCWTFDRDTGFGERGTEVDALNTVLIKEGIITGNVGGTMVDTREFDQSMVMAVKTLQGKYGISQTGFLGPITRARLAKLYGCQTSIEVISPNDTKEWVRGTKKQILWKSNESSDNNRSGVAHISLLQQGGTMTCTTCLSGVCKKEQCGSQFIIGDVLDRGSHDWLVGEGVPKIPDGNYKFKVCVGGKGSEACDEGSSFDIVSR